MTDKKLWKVFSEYIRRRDADENGYVKCFTCGLIQHWKKMDCGHGIGRQHWATRYNEQNNAPQCKKCNGFEGGRTDVYAKEVDKRYGPGTWDKLNILSRVRYKKPSQFEIDVMEAEYKKLVKLFKN